jgi:hypothetical protein
VPIAAIGPALDESNQAGFLVGRSHIYSQVAWLIPLVKHCGGSKPTMKGDVYLIDETLTGDRNSKDPTPGLVDYLLNNVSGVDGDSIS